MPRTTASSGPGQGIGGGSARTATWTHGPGLNNLGWARTSPGSERLLDTTAPPPQPRGGLLSCGVTASRAREVGGAVVLAEVRDLELPEAGVVVTAPRRAVRVGHRWESARSGHPNPFLVTPLRRARRSVGACSTASIAGRSVPDCLQASGRGFDPLRAHPPVGLRPPSDQGVRRSAAAGRDDRGPLRGRLLAGVAACCLLPAACCLLRYGLLRYGLLRYGLLRYGLLRYGLLS